MAGLPGEFSIRSSDIPRELEKRSWRSLPPDIIRALDSALPGLEAKHGIELRVAVELLMDTGRRPDEICQLPLECLEADPQGPVLVYTDYKTNKPGRLPISTSTADIVRNQQTRIRQRYLNRDQTQLVLLSAAARNPHGHRALRATTLTNIHRSWVDSLPQLTLDEGTSFPRTGVVPYSYRHIVPDGAALRDLGGVPEGQPIAGALFGDLALEHQLLDRARYLEALADTADHADTRNLARRLQAAHQETIEWITSVLVEEASGEPTKVRPTPVQKAVRRLTSVIILPARRTAEWINADR